MLILAFVVFLAAAALLANSAGGPATSGSDSGVPRAGIHPAILSADQLRPNEVPRLSEFLFPTSVISSPGPETQPLTGLPPAPSDVPFAQNRPIWRDSSAQTRPSVAMDSGGRIYVAFQHEATPGNHDIYVSRSLDLGVSWQTPVRVASTSLDEVNPSIVSTEQSNQFRLVVFYQHNGSADQFRYAWSWDFAVTWNTEVVTIGGPIGNYQFPSFASHGVKVAGMYQVWCTVTGPPPNTCQGGAWTIAFLRNMDVSNPAGWGLIYFFATPDTERRHPASAMNQTNDTLVGALESEVYPDTWDLTYFRIYFSYSLFAWWVDGTLDPCGTSRCPSTQPIWPSVSADGSRAVVGGQFFNASFAPDNTILGAYSNDVPAGWTSWRLIAGGTGRIDPSSTSQKYVSFALQGTEVLAEYWKDGAVASTNSFNGGETFGTPVRVSDNTPGTAIDDPRAIVVMNSTAGPLTLWHDSRDGDANIYFTGVLRYTVTIDTDVPYLVVRFDNGPFWSAPQTQIFGIGSVHRIETQPIQPGQLPGERYVFTHWNDSTTDNPKTVTVTANVTYTASFVTQYDVTVATDPTGLSITVDGTTQTGPYTWWCDAGPAHTLDAPSPQPAGTTSQFRFGWWSDGGAQTHSFTCAARGTITATFVVQWEITITTTPAGRDITVDSVAQVAPYVFWCDNGTQPELGTTGPQSGGAGTQYIFQAWSDGLPQTHLVLCDRPRMITASFLTQYQIILATNPTGLGVMVDGVQQTAPFALWCDATTTHTVDVTSPQSAGPTNRYRFDTWSDSGAQGHSIRCDAPATLTAIFRQQFLIHVRTVPGTLSVVVDGATYSSGAAFWFDENSGHDLLAITPQAAGPDTRYAFNNWEAGPSKQAWTVTVAGSTDYVADYRLQYMIRLDSNPAGLVLLVDGLPATAPGSFWWDAGSSHAIDANSPQYSGATTRYVFASWSDGDPTSGKTLLVDGPKSLTGIYMTQYLLTMSANAGTLTPGTGWQDAGAVVSIVASPPTGSATDRYTFSGWTGDYTGTLPTGSITIDRPKSVRASWIHEFRVEILSSPSAQAIDVDGVPVTTPAVLWWVDGSNHTITAPPTIPVGPGDRWAFASWDGGGTNTVRTTSLQSGPASYTATFARQYEITFATSPSGQSFVLDGIASTGPFALWCDATSAHGVDVPSPQAVGAGTRYRFDSWSDAGPAAHTVTCTAPSTITANFVRQFLVSLLTDPASGPVLMVDGAAHAPSDVVWWDENSVHTIDAGSAPQLYGGGTRYVFSLWHPDGSTAHSVDFAVTAPGTVTAVYRTEYLLTISSEFGDPACQNAREIVPGGCWYEANTDAKVAVTTPVQSPRGKVVFTGWSGDVSSPDPALKVTMDGPKTAKANWRSVGFFEEFGFLVALVIGIAASLMLLLLFLARRKRKSRGKQASRDSEAGTQRSPKQPR